LGHSLFLRVFLLLLLSGFEQVNFKALLIFASVRQCSAIFLPAFSRQSSIIDAFMRAQCLLALSFHLFIYILMDAARTFADHDDAIFAGWISLSSYT